MTTYSWPNPHSRMKKVLKYAATHPNAKLRYIVIVMHIWIHSDTSYLNEPKAHSRAGDNFYLSDKPNLTIKDTNLPPTLNAHILVNNKVVDAVISSAQESKYGAVYINTRYSVPTQTALQEMKHPQGPTTIQFDDKCATGIINETVTQCKSKAIDMRWYWLCVR